MVGAKKTQAWMESLGFPKHEVTKVTRLVRQHQFRFYKDSNPETIRRWCEELGSYQAFKDQLAVRYADRRGNGKNLGKPAQTKELYELEVLVASMIDDNLLVFPADLKVSWKDITNLKIPKTKHKEAMANMLGIVRADKTRNTREYLLDYLKRNYTGTTNG